MMLRMTLALYFFRQYIPSFFFGFVLFLFVLLLDRLFDIIDLVFNKGVPFLLVGHLFILFIPTVFPLTLPMACLLAALMTFGRMSEENELTAVRAAGVSLWKALWAPPLFALLISMIMIPFNTRVAPWANRGFRAIYEKIANADPLINIQAKKFFAIKNIKLYANGVNKKSQELSDLFVYESSERKGEPPERIFARKGILKADPDAYRLSLSDGQLQKYHETNPKNIIHTTFHRYDITLPIDPEKTGQSTRYRNFSSKDLTTMIADLKKQGLPPFGLQAERSLRIAIAFAPLALSFVGIPLATALKRGGKGFGFGVAIVVIFIYYTLLIFGLTMAEKGLIPPDLSLWMGNIACIAAGLFLMRRALKQ
jgi:lipopolysaccharide export system permease protein